MGLVKRGCALAFCLLHGKEFPSVLIRCRPYPPRVVDEFQEYCRPVLNPVLSNFCTDLTAITQETVNSADLFVDVLAHHTAWLRGHGLVPNGEGLVEDSKSVRSAVVTWSDADVAHALRVQCRNSNVKIPVHFNQWINLKVLFKQHYKREPSGGLQCVVESLGCKFTGRAHSGIVDCRNTGKIVLQMMEQGFRFRRTTRGFGPDGHAWGSRPRFHAGRERSGPLKTNQ